MHHSSVLVHRKQTADSYLAVQYFLIVMNIIYCTCVFFFIIFRSPSVVQAQSFAIAVTTVWKFSCDTLMMYATRNKFVRVLCVERILKRCERHPEWCFSRPTRTYQTYPATPPTFLIWNNLCELVYQRPTRSYRSQTAVA